MTKENIYKCELCGATVFHIIDGEKLQCQHCGGEQEKIDAVMKPMWASVAKAKKGE